MDQDEIGNNTAIIETATIRGSRWWCFDLAPSSTLWLLRFDVTQAFLAALLLVTVPAVQVFEYLPAAQSTLGSVVLGVVDASDLKSTRRELLIAVLLATPSSTGPFSQVSARWLDVPPKGTFAQTPVMLRETHLIMRDIRSSPNVVESCRKLQLLITSNAHPPPPTSDRFQLSVHREDSHSWL
jgi:hypothetical protein